MFNISLSAFYLPTFLPGLFLADKKKTIVKAFFFFKNEPVLKTFCFIKIDSSICSTCYLIESGCFYTFFSFYIIFKDVVFCRSVKLGLFQPVQKKEATLRKVK